ncbi:MAG: Ppx/GppA family phosphatase, partial [Caulobacteraceae bacterium]|nr:Ppx/GppA family phosphatase [Caulobacteraceae bacterium]
MSEQDDRAPRDVAVIDVGSNSVRLVVYRLEGRAIWTVYNEKVLAGLGSELAQSGRLSPRGVQDALSALRRFSAVLDAAPPARLLVAGTAAVRDAKDGAEFVARISAETGLAVRVLTGEDEARYAALGVLAGTPAASGLAADLGGASLELTRVHRGKVGAGVSLPLGPFNLRGPDGFDAGRVRSRSSKVLGEVAANFSAQTLYAVGGGWRNLALLQMYIASYPLRIVHQYEMSAVDALDAARFIARQSKTSLERIEGLSKRRLETLPYAAVVLETLIERLGLKRIVLSAYGLREGLLLETMPEHLRAQDPLVAGCEALGLRQGVSEDVGAALADWIWPLFSRLPPLFGERDRTLLSAACRLADVGARLHPDHRAHLVFEQVLRAPLAGLDHPERAFLAMALFTRHTTSGQPPEADILARLLTSERTARAKALGAAMRLGCDLSGRSADLLRRSRLNLEGEVITLAAEAR